MVGEKIEKIDTAEMFSFGGAQFAASTFVAFLSYYQLAFFTDIALIPPAATAVLLLCYRLFSAVDTQVIGVFINRTRFKDGKYRPYFKWCALPFAMSLAALGLTPGVGAPVRIVYAAIVLVVCDICWSAIHTASVSLLPYVAGDDITRTKFMSFSNASSIIAFIVIGTLLLPAADLFGGGDRNTGIALVLVLLAVVSVPLIFNAYFRLKERHYVETADKPAIKDIFLAVGRNKRVMLFLAGLCLYFMADSFKNLNTYYYVARVLGRQDMLPVIIMAGLISPLVMQPVIPRLLKYAKKEALIIIGLFAAACSCFLMLAAGNQVIALIVCVVLYGVFTSIVANLTYTVIASFSDEMQIRQNISMSEILAAIMNLVSNIGSAIASGAAAFAMSAFGYSAEAASQTPGAVMGIRVLYILCTAGGMVLAGAVMLLFRRSSNETNKPT